MIFKVKPLQPIILGKQGEQRAITVEFHITDYIRQFGDGGTFSVLNRRAGEEEAYPVTVTRDGDSLLWNVSEADNAYDGHGKCELQYTIDGVIAKSESWETIVVKSLGAGSAVPSWEQEWQDRLTSISGEVTRKADEVYEAYESGELTGPQGPQGPQGNPGADYVLTETDRKDIVAKSKQPLRGAAAALVKELYIPDLKGHTVTGTTVWWGRQTGTRWYSSARIMFDNNSSLFMEVRTENLKTQAESEAALRWMAGQMHHITKTIGTDVLDVYMIFSLEGLTLTENTYNNFAVESTIDLTGITYAPNVAKQLTAYSKRIKAVAAVKDGRKFVCSEQFFRDDNVNVYHSGTLIAPSTYNQWKQGQIVFATDVSYAADDVLFELTAQQRANEDIENDLASHTGGFKKSEQYGSDKYDFVSDPAGGTNKCLKLGGTGYSAGGADRFRIQFDRQVELTEYTDEVKVFFPTALLTRLAAYSSEISWFLFGGLWAQSGPTSWASSGMYSGYALSIGLYKTSNGSLKYGIAGHERTFNSSHAETYVNRVERTFDTAVLGGEWVTIRKHFEVGVNGYYKIDIIDSAGTHSFDGHMPIGVKEPEKEAERYGTAVAADLPYRVITSIDGCKIYTSQAIAEYVLASTELAVYFKDYKCYDQQNVNAFTLLPFAEANGITMAAASVYNDTELRGMIVGKQDALTAGENIVISGTTINAVDTIYDDSAIRDRLTDAESAITDNARRDAALWDINDEQTYRRTEQTENGLNSAPTGAKYASVEEVSGKSVVWNETADRIPKTTGGTYTYDSDGIYHWTASASNQQVYHTAKVLNGNKYYSSAVFKTSSADVKMRSYMADVDNAVVNQFKTVSRFFNASYDTNISVGIRDTRTEGFDEILIKSLNVVNLTKLYGSGNEPTSVDDDRIRWIDSYLTDHPEYNAGEIVSVVNPTIKVDGVTVATINGTFRSAGTAHDSIVIERDKLTKVTRIGSVNLSERNWTYYDGSNPFWWAYSSGWETDIKLNGMTVQQKLTTNGYTNVMVVNGSTMRVYGADSANAPSGILQYEKITPTETELTFDGIGLELISTDKHITVVDADGRDVPWLAEYIVKGLPIATNTELGVVKAKTSYGLDVNSSGELLIQGAYDSDVTARRTDIRRPLMPSSIDIATKTALTTGTMTYTDSEKASACERIGAERKVGYTRIYKETHTLSTLTSLEINCGDAEHLMYFISFATGTSEVSDYGLINVKTESDNTVWGVFEHGKQDNANRTYLNVAHGQYDIGQMPQNTRFGSAGSSLQLTARGATIRKLATGEIDMPTYKIRKLLLPPMLGTVSISVWTY